MTHRAQAGRRIGFWTCTALVIGNIIGIGIFLLPASLAPFGLNALIGWVVTLIGCLALARVFADLAAAMPGADGPYGYIRATLGDVVAYMALWAYWVSLCLTDAALATGSVGYLIVVFPALQAVSPALLALVILWLFVVINLMGSRASGGVQIATTVVKLVPMVAIAVLGAWVLAHAPTSYVAHLPATPISSGGVMAATTLALFAMLGIESASVPATRVENPGRTIPRATMIGTAVTAVVYIAVSAVPLLLLPQHELGASGSPFALVMDRYGEAGLGRWLSLFVLVSGLGALNGWTLLTGELTCTMSENRVLPSPFMRRNRREAPSFALIAIGVLASLMIWMSYSKSLVAAFTFITRVVTVANLPLYLCCALALLILQWRGKIGSRVLPAAALGLAFAVFAFVGAGLEPLLLSVGLIAAGLPLYIFMKRRRAIAAAIGSER